MTAPPPTSDRGATLLEVLIALAITSLLAASVMQVAGFGLTVVERGEAASSRSASAYGDERRLRDALTTMASEGFRGDPSGLFWRGYGADDLDGAWKLSPDGQIARCDGGVCGAPADWLSAPVEAFAFAGPDDAWVQEWPLGPPPALIRLSLPSGAIIISPRIGGAK